jgi:hypothetical protein
MSEATTWIVAALLVLVVLRGIAHLDSREEEIFELLDEAQSQEDYCGYPADQTQLGRCISRLSSYL